MANGNQQRMQWTRFGECNHCGHCCVAVGQVQHELPPTPDRDDQFLRFHGYRLGDDGVFRKLLLLTTPCSEHVFDRCRRYDSRPAICRDWPRVPAEVINTPCSYWFHATTPQGNVLRIGGEGSPFPGRTLNADPRPTIDQG